MSCVCNVLPTHVLEYDSDHREGIAEDSAMKKASKKYFHWRLHKHVIQVCSAKTILFYYLSEVPHNGPQQAQ